MKRKNTRSPAQVRTTASARKAKPKSSLAAKVTRAKSSRDKVRAYRARMRAKGLRLVQIWVPDTRTSESPTSTPSKPLRARLRAAVAIRKAWAKALDTLPLERPAAFGDIADLVGSIDGLPTDLASNKDRYLRAGYGRKPHR